ncbi:MAG: hypothetical protein IPM54_27240 [Polyangiaceae bacterium]|nr:hypothetical protein [Polyangiaceae bacterium]
MNSSAPSTRASLREKLAALQADPPRAAASIVAAMSIVSAVVIVVLPWLRITHTLGFHDWDVQTSHRQLVKQSLLEHFEMPFWNPYACGGFPAWGYVEAGTILVSPWLAAYLFLPMALALRIEVVGMAFVGAIGAYAAASRFTSSHAARALVVALWAVNGRWGLQTAVGHTWHLAYAFLPWVLFFFERARQTPSRWLDVSLLGASFAALVYSGGIYPLPHTVLALGLYAVMLGVIDKTVRPLVILGVGGLLGVGLSAPKLVPMLDVFGKAPRLVPSTESLEIGAFFTLLTSPDQSYFSRPARVSPYGWHEWGMYISLPGVILLALGLLLVQGKREAALKVAGVVLGILGFGAFHPAAPWTLLHAIAPVFKSQHVPSRFLYPAVLLLAIVAAAGIGRIIERAGRRRPWIDAAAGMLVFALALDIARVAQLPMNQSMWMVPPDKLPQGREFFFTQEAPFQYKRRDWAGPLYLAMLGNTGVINCYGTPPFDRRGALAKTDPRYRGELFVAEGQGTAKIANRTLNSVTMSLDGITAETLVVYNMNFDEGWRASAGTVVNKDNRVAVRVPAGTREVTLRYRAPGFVLGLVVGLGSLLACIALVRRERREEAGKVTG